MIGGQNRCIKHTQSKPQGQTLLELIVVLGIFLTMVSAIVGSFISAIAAERRAITSQEVLSNARATIETMMRAIRQADPDTITTAPAVCASSPCLEFNHPIKGVMQYYLSGTQIYENSGGSDFFITPDNVNVQSLGFILIGNDPITGTSDQIQPRVTMTVAVRANPAGGPTLSLQTTVSLRSPQE